jgi:hypothetical protein
MANVGRNPDARCDTGKGEKKSNLEAPKEVLDIQWTEKKDACSKQQPEAGVFPAAASSQLPDIENADQGQEPDHEQLSPGVPMRQPGESESDQARKKNSMFIMWREKVTEPESASCRLLEKCSGSVPLVEKRGVNAIPKDENGDEEGGKEISSSLRKLTMALGSIQREVR